MSNDDLSKRPDFLKQIVEVMSRKRPASHLVKVMNDLTLEVLLRVNADDALVLLEVASHVANKVKPDDIMDVPLAAYRALQPTDEAAAKRAVALWEKAFDRLPSDEAKIDQLEFAYGASDTDMEVVKGTNALGIAFTKKWNSLPESPYKTEALKRMFQYDDKFNAMLEKHVPEIFLPENMQRQNKRVKETAKPISPEIRMFLEDFREWAEKQKTLQHGRG